MSNIIVVDVVFLWRFMLPHADGISRLQVYQRMLCKRLIYRLSASMDAEEAMINRLKVRQGKGEGEGG